jgi:TPP-dependent pyruvate/acetoin dehydrogenase alpha subunit
VIRLRKYLTTKGIWDDTKQAALDEASRVNAAEVVKTAETIAKPAKTDIFDYTYATIPPELEVQRRTMQTHSLGQHPEQVGLSS